MELSTETHNLITSGIHHKSQSDLHHLYIVWSTILIIASQPCLCSGVNYLMPSLLWCVIVIIASHPGLFSSQLFNIDPPTIYDLWMWGQWNPTTWCFPIHWRFLPCHLVLPFVQLKPKLWLSLTSSYELGFKCCFHRWNQDEEHFGLKLSLSRFCHWFLSLILSTWSSGLHYDCT